MELRRRRFLAAGAAMAAALPSSTLASHPKSNGLENAQMPLINITASGVYNITADYTASGPSDSAIVVAPNVHNVTIILYSRLVSPLFSTAQQNAGILFTGNNNSCQVIGMGGHVRGFGWGLRADNCHNMSVNELAVCDALMRGLKIEGNNAVVRECTVRNVYGSTFSVDQYCIGIEVFGAAPTVMGNIVQDFRGTANGEGVGISVTDQAVGGVVKGNVSTGSLVNGAPRPKSIAYWVGGASDVDFVGNHGANCSWGLAASTPTMGLFDENTFRNCTTPYLEDQGDWIVGGSDG